MWKFPIKKQILFFLLFVNFFAFAQENCKYSVTVNSDNLKQTGKFKLTIKNTDNQFFKIPRNLNLCEIRLVDLEFFNEESQSFEKTKGQTADIDCLYVKPRKLKPNKTYVYEVNIKSDFDTMLKKGFFEKWNDKKYRFKLSFYLNGSKNKYCGSLITDWIYKN